MSRRGWLIVFFSWVFFAWLGHPWFEMVSSAQSVVSPQPADGPVVPANVLAGFQERAFVGDNGSPRRYRVLLPKGFSESGATKYPLVLFLHGAGERGSDNSLQLKHVAREFLREDRQKNFPCIAVFPQCEKDKKWVEVDWKDKASATTFPAEPSSEMAMALGIVNEWIAGGRVDPTRVYVTGISMGGYGTWFAAALKDNPFAAALPICGGGDPRWANRYSGMPIWTLHGTADAAVPVTRSREIISALKQVGQQPEPIYTELADAGHDIWTETYKRDDIFEWLFSQRK